MTAIEGENRLRSTANEEAASKNFAATLSLSTAAFLIILKIATGWVTGSISIWASLLDSVMDIVASAINLIAIRASIKPPDEDHAYGHGKAESLAGLLQSALITISALFLIREAVHRLFNPPGTNLEWVGILSMLIAIAASIGLVAYLKHVARRTDSPAIDADAAHYASDVYTNSGAVVALLITILTGWKLADPLISILISAVILWSAVAIARESIDVLMDRRLPIEIDEQIAEIVERYKDQGVLGFHDLRTRRSGSQKFIDLHLEVERTKRLEEAHELTERIIHDIESEVSRSSVQIHTDPV
jgi:ferrous-iron efflux pump FieF